MSLRQPNAMAAQPAGRRLPLPLGKEDEAQVLSDAGEPTEQLSDAPAALEGVQLAQAPAAGGAASGGAGGAGATPATTATPAPAAAGAAAAAQTSPGVLAAIVGGALALGAAGGGGGGGGSEAPARDTTPPSAPTAVLAQDTGASGADRITSVGTVNVTGLEAGATWQYSTDGGAHWAAGSGGSFTLAAGAHTGVQVRQIDSAGNIGAAADLGAVTVDSTAPSLSVKTFDRAAQTLTLTYDGPLDDGHPPAASAFSVMTNGVPNAVDGVQVVGNQVILTLHDAFDTGGVSITYVDAAGDDAAAIQDLAGNDAVGFVNGILADGYVRDASVYIDTNGNGVADPGVDFFVGTTDPSGNFFIPTGAPTTGTLIAVGGVNIDTGLPNTLPLKAPAGSTTINPLTTLVQAVIEASPTTDTATAAQQVASALGLIVPEGQDLTTYDPLGAGDVDTQIAAAQVASVLTVAASVDTATVTAAVTNLASAIEAATTGSTTVDLTDPTTLTDVLGGDSALGDTASTVTTDISNATSLDEISTVQAVAFDTLSPNAPTLSVPSVTNQPGVTVSFNVTATDGTAAVAGDTVTIFDGANAIATQVLSAAHIAAGQVFVVLDALGSGSYSLSAQLNDQAGNLSVLSAAATLNVDLAAPGQPVITGISPDTGVAGDGITSNSGTVTVLISAEAGSTVELVRQSDNATATAIETSAGVFSVTYSGLGQGTNVFQAFATDAAGNKSVGSALSSVTTDTLAPAAPTVALRSDTGVNGDGITSVSTVDVSGLEPNATWQYSTNGGTGWSTGSGSSFTLSAGTYASGQVLVRQTDVAGNASGTGALSGAVTVDATLPAQPVITGFTPDTGVQGDGITANGGTVTVLISAEAGSTVQLVRQSDNATATATETSAGVFSVTLSALGQGTHVYQAFATDAAGNASVGSALSSVTIDTLAPAAPTLALRSDTGTPGDGITSATTVDVTGLEPNATWQYSTNGGTGWTTGTGSSFTLSVGTYASGDILVRQTDTAGNASDTGALSGAVTILAGAPAAPVITGFTPDTGVQGDGITANGGTVTVQITAEAGSTVQVVRLSDDAVQTATEVSPGVFESVWSGLGQGTNQFQAVASNAAGDFSPYSATTSVTIDTLAPVAPTVNAVTSTADRTPVLSGTASLGTDESLSVTVDSTTYTVGDGYLTLSGTTWTLNLTTDLSPGAHTVVATATDAAGNTSTSATTPVTVQAYGATTVNWTAERSNNLLASGDQIVMLVHFTDTVVLDTAGGTPIMNLVIVDDAGQSHTVAAQASLPEGVQPGSPVSSLYFTYTLTSADVGRYHVDKIDLNGGTITSTADSLPANITLTDGGTKVTTAATYLYGEVLTTTSGTGGNDVLAPFQSATTAPDLSTVTGGAGARDVLAVPIFMAGITTFADAHAVTLRYVGGVVEAVTPNGSVVGSFTVPGTFPSGIESLVFYATYQDGATIADADVPALQLDAAIVSSTDPVFTTDNAVRGSLGNDTINVSSDTSTSTRYLIRGGAGNDTITGHDGADYVAGDGGTNTINLGGGNDIAFIGRGTDTVDGGAGSDLIVANLFNASGINLSGRLVGFAVSDTSNNFYYRVDVNDSNQVTVRDFNSNTLLMTASNMETLQVRYADGGSRRGLAFLWGDGTDNTLTNTTTGQVLISGGIGNDVLNAGTTSDMLYGGSGDDTLNGGTGNNQLKGGAGNDTLNGSDGSDWLVGEAGNDVIDGGTGTDSAGFAVAGVAGAGDLSWAYDSVANVVRVSQGNVELARITKNSNGLVVQDLVPGSGSYFGTDTVTNVETLTFDYGGVNSALSISVADFDSLLQVPVPPTYGATTVNWTAERSSAVLTAGDDIVMLVHFSNDVIVDATGGTPKLALQIVNDAGQMHTVYATATLPVPADTAVSSLYFRYTLTGADVGRYHVDSIYLNGGTITSTADNLPADITLTDLGSKTPTAGTYLYGELLTGVTGTAGNDALNPFEAITTGVTTGDLATVNGGAGDRDVLGVPIFLTGITTYAEARAVSLQFSGGVVSAVTPDGTVVGSFTVPASFPAGIETLLFYATYHDGVANATASADITPVQLDAAIVTSVDPILGNEFAVRGSKGADTIDLSSDTSTVSRYVVRGGAGNDTITGHAGADFVFGDGGTNTISTGDGDDIVFVGRGSDTVDGGAGTDRIAMNLFNASTINLQGRLFGFAVTDGANYYYRVEVTDSNQVTVRDFNSNTLLMTASNMESLQVRYADGGARRSLPILWGDDTGNTLTNDTTGQVLISGGAGNDTLTAGTTNDMLYGGSGNDTLVGGTGNNQLNGGAGNDTLGGGDGGDWLVGDMGDDLIDGGAGTDSAGFRVAGVAGAGNLTWHYDSVANSVDVRQGNVDLARIYKSTTGYVVQDRIGNSPNYFGTDAVRNVESLSFDFSTSPGTLDLSTSMLDSLFDSNTNPSFAGVSFINGTSVAINFSESVTWGTDAGPTGAVLERLVGGAWETVTVASVSGNNSAAFTVNLSGVTLTGADVLRLTYDGSGNLRDADSGNPVTANQVFFGGGGNNTIDLSEYYDTWMPVTLRGNGGNDTLIGTHAGDRLADGNGNDLMDGGWGRDIYQMTEDNTTVNAAADTIRIGLGQSALGFASAGMDVVRSSSVANSGFYIGSTAVPLSSTNDKLSLTYAAILADAAITNGTDAGGVAQHSISGGIVTFRDSTGGSLLIDLLTIDDAAGYVRSNASLLGGTGAFRYDSNFDGVADATVVFQGYGATATADGIPLTGVVLAGLTTGTLGNTAGQGIIQIVDTVASDPYRVGLSSNGITLRFAEGMTAPAGVAFTLKQNGTTDMTGITATFSDGDRVLDIHSSTTLGANDWVLMQYGGTSVTDALADKAGNLLTNGPSSNWGGNAIGNDNADTIDLSAFDASKSYDLNGNGGNDTLTGSGGSDFLDGGVGGDLMTGGAGTDDFKIEQGDSPAISSVALGLDNALGNGDTFSFANGVDVITDLQEGEGFGLNVHLSDVLGYDDGAAFMGTQGNTAFLPTDGKAANQGFFLVQGDFTGTNGNGSFSVNDAGTDTLVVYDGDSSQAVTQTALVLQDVTLTDLNFYPGSNWVSHIWVSPV